MASTKNLEESTTSYQALASDDVEAVKLKNQQLEVELEKARSEAAKYKSDATKSQRLCDSTVENLLQSMKQMNDTVSKMEKDAGK